MSSSPLPRQRALPNDAYPPNEATARSFAPRRNTTGSFAGSCADVDVDALAESKTTPLPWTQIIHARRKLKAIAGAKYKKRVSKRISVFHEEEEERGGGSDNNDAGDTNDDDADEKERAVNWFTAGRKPAPGRCPWFGICSRRCRATVMPQSTKKKRKKKKQAMLIDPRSNFRRGWDLLLAFWVLYFCWTVPFSLGFSW